LREKKERSMSFRRAAYRVGQTAKRTAFRVGQAARGAAFRVGQSVGKAARSVLRGTDIAQGVIKGGQSVRNVVRGINERTGGLLEEGVRRLPFGDDVVLGARGASKALDAAGGVIRKVRRGAQTIERTRARAQRPMRDSFS
jgi:hypothetical protein